MRRRDTGAGLVAHRTAFQSEDCSGAANPTTVHVAANAETLSHECRQTAANGQSGKSTLSAGCG